MISIEHKFDLDEEIYKLIDVEFNKYAIKNDVTCDYRPFCFVAKDGEKIIGILTGKTYYKEVNVGDLVILEEYRNKHIGSQLMHKVEEYYKDKGFENINLTTYEFQAPEFYKKCGFTLEFIRENKENKKLSKYFFVKYFNK